MENKIESVVSVIVFALYRRVGKPGHASSFVEVLAGARSGRFNEQGRVELEAGSVPFNLLSFERRAVAPDEGLLALYGRDALQELAQWRARARQLDAEFACAEVKLAVGRVEPQLMSREMLRAHGERLRFVALRRMRSELQSDFCAAFNELRPEANITRPIQLAMHPDLWPAALDSDADLRHISVFATMVADGPAPRQLALVRPGARVHSVHQLNTESTIVLPSWLSHPRQVLSGSQRQRAEHRGEEEESRP